LSIGGGGSSFSTGGGSSFSSGGGSSFSSGGSSGFSSGGSGSISAFFPVNTVGGGQGRLTGVSDLFVSGGGIGGRGGRGGNVLITSAGTGQSNIISGKVITDGKFPSANINAFTNSNSNVDSNVLASRIIRNARNISSRLSVDLDDVFTRLPSL
jgi:hypothetical protein